MEIEPIWMIWFVGVLTGGLSTYLGCILFMRRILKEEAELMRFLTRKETITTVTTYEGKHETEGQKA